MSIGLACAVTGFFNNYIFKQFCQHATWLARITPDMPGAMAAGGYDVIRQVETVTSDGTFGVGWYLVQDGTRRNGYLAPMGVDVLLLEEATSMRALPEGFSEYTRPSVVYKPGLSPWRVSLPQTPSVGSGLQKGDILVMSDGRRFAVEDQFTPGQVFGKTVVLGASLEYRSPNNIAYQVPAF